MLHYEEAKLGVFGFSELLVDFLFFGDNFSLSMHTLKSKRATNYSLVPSSMSKVLIVYDSRIGKTKLAAKAIVEGEREADLDVEVKRG